MARETRFQSRKPKLAEGAAHTAPTAPHATPPVADGAMRARKKTGPDRFWNRRMHLALLVGFFLSLVLHYVLGPWSLLPSGPAVELHDVDGELTIPIDAVMEAVPQENPQATEANAAAAAAAAALAKGNTLAVDASTDRDMGGDAKALGTELDAGTGDANENGDGAPREAFDDAGVAIGGGDGGVPIANLGRDPASLLGAAAGVSAGPNNVTLLVNTKVIKAHPEGAKLAPIFAAIPQWKQFMSGSSLNPLTDTDWILIMGPSLINTQKDAIYVQYSAPDAAVDAAIDGISKTYAKGGKIDVGVKGVKAWKAYAEGSERVFLRPRSHIAVIVPATHATQFATVISQNPLAPHFRPGEAMSLRALRPGGSISLIPQSISEMRLWIVPRNSDGGADVFAEGDCPDAVSAADAAQKFKQAIASQNSLGVRFVTAGILNGVEVTSDGPMVKMHMSASKEQIDAVLGLAAQRVGATLPSDPPAASSH